MTTLFVLAGDERAARKLLETDLGVPSRGDRRVRIVRSLAGVRAAPQEAPYIVAGQPGPGMLELAGLRRMRAVGLGEARAILMGAGR